MFKSKQLIYKILSYFRGMIRTDKTIEVKDRKDTNKALEMLAQHHKEFIKAAKSISGNHYDVMNYAEDFVQEAYIKLSRYEDLYEKIVNKKGKVTKGYMFFALRSIILNSIKKKSNLDYNFVRENEYFETNFDLKVEELDEALLAIEGLEDEIYIVLDKALEEERINWFDLKMFRTYMQKKKSFKTLAKETTLGEKTIYLSIKRCKLIIAQEMFEDYKAYINRF